METREITETPVNEGIEVWEGERQRIGRRWWRRGGVAV
jgi:hypothetical protein